MWLGTSQIPIRLKSMAFAVLSFLVFRSLSRKYRKRVVFDVAAGDGWGPDSAEWCVARNSNIYSSYSATHPSLASLTPSILSRVFLQQGSLIQI